MGTKEGVSLPRVRAFARLRGVAVMRTAEWGIRFLLGAVLSGAEVLGGASPFGMGFVAASGPGLGGFAALLGTCFGYISFLGLTNGLRYLAASVLIFSVSFAFYDLRIYRRRWFMPLVTALFSGCTGIIYLASGDWSGRLAVLFASEIALAGAAAYFYRIAFSAWERRGEGEGLPLPNLVSGLILGGTVLIALAGLSLPGGLSFGRIAACGAVMAVAWKGGPGFGAAAGIAAGVAMDLASGGPPYYGMAYSFAGLMGGVFWRQGKLFAALAYVLANAVAVLWSWDTGAGMILLYEVFVGSVLFFVVPERLLRRAGTVLTREDVPEAGGERIRYVKSRLSATAEAFRELCRSIRPALVANDADEGTIFEAAAGLVCRGCPLRETCWQQNYQSTRDAMNHALPAAIDRGHCTAADFPDWFRSRCVRLSGLMEAAGEEVRALLARRRVQSRLRDSRRAVCHQYEELAELLGSAAAELSAELTPDRGRAVRLHRHLTEQNLDGEVAVFYDEDEHLRAEVEGSGLSVLATEEALSALSAVLGVPLRPPEISEGARGTRLVFEQAEPLMAVAGVAARQRDGETTSGDAGTWFKHRDGTLYVLLCDGMGSGEGAYAESSLTVRLLEKFLQAGVPPEAALKTLNSALALRDEAAGGFSTVDLLAVSLFTGEGAVYKYGAAPTYLKKGGEILRITGASLPAGLMDGEGVTPDVARFHVSAGDCVVLISDGVTADGDEEVRRRLTAFDGVSPKDLACALVAGEAADDRTAIVLQMKNR